MESSDTSGRVKRAHSRRGAAQARVPRLRLGRRRDLHRRPHRGAPLASASSTTSRRCCASSRSRGTPGIGHTRWATHGRPSEQNAHPHRAGKVVVIHNGIIENYLELRADAAKPRPHASASETDTEVISHLIDEYVHEGLRPRRGHAPGGRASSRARSRSSCMSRERARPPGGGEERDADRARPRRRRELRRVRHPGDPRPHAPRRSSSRTARWPR